MNSNSEEQQYVDSTITIYTNVYIFKTKKVGDFPKEKNIRDAFLTKYRLDPNLKKVTDYAIKQAKEQYKKDTEEYVKATKTLYIQITLLKGDKANFPNETLVRSTYLQKYAFDPKLRENTNLAIKNAIAEQGARSNQTLSSKTSNPLLVLKQAIMKNYRLKLDKKAMKNNALNEMISESDSSVMYFKKQVKPEDIQNVEEKALYDYLVIVVRNYINPIKNDPKKITLKMIYDNEIDELISKNAFLADKRQEIESAANNNDYVILEGFRIFEGFKHIGIC
jgi:hypothetical protein